MSRRYPEIRDAGKLAAGNLNNKECEACEKIASHCVRVAWDYMRGNDDSFYVCQRHLDIAQASLKRFIAHMNTKEKFLNRTVSGEQP